MRLISSLHLSPNYLIRQSVTDLLGDESVQRSCSKLWIVSSFGQPISYFVVYFDRDSSFVKSLLEFLETNIYNVSEGIHRESPENDEFVNAIKEFWGI